jgi:hypothetical protein
MLAIGWPAPGTDLAGDGGARCSLPVAFLNFGRVSWGVWGRPRVPEVMLACLKLETLEAPRDEAPRCPERW